jgi:ABC-type multidrug transport system ATPase subunit
VLLSTNDLAFAEGVCARVILLHEGRVILEGAPADLLRDHRASVTYRLQTVDELVPMDLPPGFSFTPVAARAGLFRTSTGGSLAELVSALERFGNRINALEVHRADLSDVFRAATGVAWTPASEAQP